MKGKIDAFRRSLGFNVIDAFNSKQEALTKTINKENWRRRYSNWMQCLKL